MNKPKHAFLIIAHNKFEQLQFLLSLLDDVRNDIFIHIDKKVKKIPNLSTKKSQLYILPNRIDVRWGDVSQIKAELALFEAANKHGVYQIYHLLSGVDFPIKSNDYIHTFINNNPNTQFVGFSKKKSKSLEWNVKRYHFFTRHYKNNNILKKIFFNCLRYICELFVNLLISRQTPPTLHKGAQWVSITYEFCDYIIKRKNDLIKNYEHTCCSDEIFIQTLLWNSPFKEQIYTLETEFKGCMRLIDWNRGTPYEWGNNLDLDIKIIKESQALFARKFDIQKFPKIKEVIKEITQ